MVGIFWIYVHVILVAILHDGDAIEKEIIARKGQFRYMVYIETLENECGGAILDNYHILTAAHCINGIEVEDMKIIAGVTELSLVWSETRYVKIKKIYIHPHFDRQSKNRSSNCFASIFRCFSMSSPRIIEWKNDIAVLTLTEPLLFGNRIMKVNLPRTDFIPSYIRIHYAGWSVATKLKRAKLHYIELIIFPSGACRKLDKLYRENEFYGTSSSGNCDKSLVYDGSPLVEGNTVYGVASRGESGVIIFMQVFPHLDFILKAMNDENTTDDC